MSMSKRLKIIMGVVGAILVLGTAATIYYWPALSGFFAGVFGQETSEETDEVNTPAPVVKTDAKLYENAAAAAASGGAEAGQAVFNEQLAATNSKSEKAAIYSQKAELALTPAGGANTAQALEFAYLAEQEAPTYATALFIAEIEFNDMNNRTNALKYYKLYLERLTDEGIALNPGDKEYFEQRIREIEESL
jgi:hypothetical protein